MIGLYDTSDTFPTSPHLIFGTIPISSPYNRFSIPNFECLRIILASKASILYHYPLAHENEHE